MAANKAAGAFDFESVTLAELMMTDFLTCDQCQKTYTCPVLLPCLHTLCGDCFTHLTTLAQNTQHAGQKRNNTRSNTETTNKDLNFQNSLISEQPDPQRTIKETSYKDPSLQTSQMSQQVDPQRTNKETSYKEPSYKDPSHQISLDSVQTVSQRINTKSNSETTNKDPGHHSSQNTKPAGPKQTNTETRSKDLKHDSMTKTDAVEQGGSIKTARSGKVKLAASSEAKPRFTNNDESHKPMKTEISDIQATSVKTEQASDINAGKNLKLKSTKTSEAKLSSVNKDEGQKLITKVKEQNLTTDKTIKTNVHLGSMNKTGQNSTSTPRTDAQLNSTSKSNSRNDGKVNSTNKSQKSSLVTSNEKLNVINVKEDKLKSKTRTEAQGHSTNDSHDPLLVNVPKTTPRNDNEKQILTSTVTPKSTPRGTSTSQSILNSDALLDPSNTDESTTQVSTERSDFDLNDSSIDLGLLTYLSLNCDLNMESTPSHESNPVNTAGKTNDEKNPSQTSGASVPIKSNENGVELIRIQCPVCLALMETKNESLKRVNMFVKHLCEVRSYKEDYGRTCEYCKYDGKTITATTLCLDCQDDLCEGCVKAHQRTRVTRDHQLAPYEQIQKGLYDHDIRNHQSVLCHTHSKEMEFFCVTCAVLLCKECKTELHADHKVKSVTKTFVKYKQQLESFLQGIKRRIPTIADYSNFLTTHSKQMITTRAEIEESIDQQAKQLHQLIDEHKAKLTDNLTTAFDQELQVIKGKCKDLGMAEKSLGKNAEFLSHLLKFGKPEEVLIMHQPIANRLKQLVHMKPDSLKMRLSTTFKAGSATDQNIAIMFGNLTLERVPFNEEDSEQTSLIVASLLPTVLSPPEMIQSFDMKGITDSSEVWPTGLVITESNYIIVDRDNRMVKIFNKDGQLQQQFSGDNDNHLGSPFDATILKNGNIAVTDYKSEDVKIFDPSGRFVMSIKGNFRYPRGITTNRNGDIVVVDCHRLQITTHNPDTGECISIISGTDAVNKHLVDPYYIAVTDDDNFVVTDHAAPNIKIFNQSGECLAQYGTYGTYQGQVLQPYGVCVDRHGYIFVADHQNSRIHMLLPDGRFSKFLLTKRDKLRNPVAVGVDTNDHLVVAEALGKVKVWKYM